MGRILLRLSPGPRRGKLPVLMMVVVALAAAGTTFAVTKFATKGDKPKPAAQNDNAAASKRSDESQLGPPETVDLGEFLVNVLDSHQALRYVKAEVSLVVRKVGAEPEPSGGGHGHGSPSKAADARQLPPDEHRLARDVVIRVLSAQSFEALVRDAGREKLRATLRDKLDAALEHYQVKELLITGFVMQ